MAIELLFLVPVVVFFLLLLVGLYRYTHGRQLVDDASAAAARAASLAVSPAQARTEAHQVAADVVRHGGVSCQPMGIDMNVSAFGPGGQVAVTIECTARLSTLAMTGLPQAVTLSATSTAPLETYRVFTP